MPPKTRDVVRELAGAARERRTITYGRLMRRFGLSRGRNLSRLIGRVDRKEQESGAPGFAAIIVRKDTGYPGGGYFCDDELPLGLRRPKARGTDPKLSAAEKDHIRRQREKIWAYYARGRVTRISGRRRPSHPEAV